MQNGGLHVSQVLSTRGSRVLVRFVASSGAQTSRVTPRCPATSVGLGE